MATNNNIPPRLEIDLILGQDDPLEPSPDFEAEMVRQRELLQRAGLRPMRKARMGDANVEPISGANLLEPGWAVHITEITPVAVQELGNMFGIWIDRHQGRKVRLIDGVVQDEADTRETFVEKLNRVVWRHSAGK